MLGQIFSAIGGAIGNAFGGGILSSVGRFAGRMLGSYVESDKTNNTEQFQPREYYSLKNLKESFNVTRAIYGHPIALIFGSMKQDGKIIWASKIKELRNTQSEQQYFRDYSNIRSIRHTTLCEYYLSFAVALCEGEILEVARVWANDNIINLDDYKFRLYKGSEDQMPDPLIIANCLPGQAPAYRGLAYIVFEDLPLSDFDQNVPVFSFEIIRKANIANTNCVEDIVKSMVIIPGSGEYVYDTKIQYKFSKNQAGKDTAKNVINSHNYSDLADSVHSLNQLLQICENIEWVSPVVCWFGDSTNVSLCKIKPAVEFNDSNITYSEEWKVGYYRRSSAKLISRDIEGNPKYGGSVNDDSILRYLEELKSRNLKIMFYPMCFLDVEGKPWRGHLTGSAEHIENFFNKDEGYNNFIIHYANLVKNHVDAFVIGSELIGLTAVRRGSQYPAVDELVKLAATVKGIMGPQVLITYAADWSEYHHTSGGWYNLDPLWSSPNIDFIGIDAYFPVTRSTTSMILTSDIEKGWKTGEGYDYYYDQAGIKRPLEAPYAWKNLEYWWENFHQNPDGNNSAWQPRMKKIWFTEFGFPSIDKATNQPNVFFDSYCVDGGMPKYSTGEIDFSIQRKAIKAFMNYWESQEYIERTFLWTWDARPYPAWPHMNIWRDGYLWEKGHWVNNKFGAANIAAIILELSNRCKINQANVDVNDLDDSIEGISFNKSMSANDAINILRISNFFDIKTTQGNKIAFIKRGLRRPCSVTSDILTKIRDNSYVERINISRKNIISKVHINYINRSDNYKKEYCQV
ncbi:MAG: baseplate megatron protein TIM-barrel domain-containing protein, partial [Janthinobacterium lividum]